MIINLVQFQLKIEEGIMNVTSYTFQSPYPNQVQVGRPDPQSQQQSQQSEAVNNFSEAANKPTEQEASAYLAQATTGASVNVASASTDVGVSSALDSFSTASSQLQATEAYTG